MNSGQYKIQFDLKKVMSILIVVVYEGGRGGSPSVRSHFLISLENQSGDLFVFFCLFFKEDVSF